MSAISAPPTALLSLEVGTFQQLDFTVSRIQRRKKARFPNNPVAQVVHVITGDSHLCWYSPYELAMFKDERRKIARAARRGECLLSSSDYCVRGFEDYLSHQTILAKKYIIKAVINIVLNEQMLQRNEGRVDESELRQASLEASHFSQSCAIKYGSSDAAEALSDYMDFLSEIFTKASSVSMNGVVRWQVQTICI